MRPGRDIVFVGANVVCPIGPGHHLVRPYRPSPSPRKSNNASRNCKCGADGRVIRPQCGAF
jgi:hypothetical protein